MQTVKLLSSLVDNMWGTYWGSNESTNRASKHTSPTHSPSTCKLTGRRVFISGLFSWLDPYIWSVCGSMRIKEQTTQRHMFKRDWSTSSNINNCFTWEWKYLGGPMYPVEESTNMHFRLTIPKSGEVWFMHMFHYRLGNATRDLLCESNWWKLENTYVSYTGATQGSTLMCAIKLSLPIYQCRCYWVRIIMINYNLSLYLFIRVATMVLWITI